MKNVQQYTVHTLQSGRLGITFKAVDSQYCHPNYQIMDDMHAYIMFSFLLLFLRNLFFASVRNNKIIHLHPNCAKVIHSFFSFFSYFG